MSNKYFSNMHVIYSPNDFYEPDRKLTHISRKYNVYSQDSIQSIVNIFKRIGESEKDKGKDVVFFSKDEFKDLFESNKWLMVGTMESKKTMIREYMRWYKENEFENWKDVDIRSTIDQINISDLDTISLHQTEWFKSLDELQKEINVILGLYDGVDIHELDVCIAAIYLAWCGVDIEEAVKIKKENIALTANQIYLPISQLYVKVDFQIMEFFRKFKDFDGYMILTKHGMKFSGYKDSNFLLRSIRNSHLSETTLRSMLTRFSERYEQAGRIKKFKYDRIKKSAQYLKIIEYEKLHGKLEVKDMNVFADLLENISITDDRVKAMFYSKYRNFQLFREYYYNNQTN